MVELVSHALEVLKWVSLESVVQGLGVLIQATLCLQSLISETFLVLGEGEAELFNRLAKRVQWSR